MFILGVLSAALLSSAAQEGQKSTTIAPEHMSATELVEFLEAALGRFRTIELRARSISTLRDEEGPLSDEAIEWRWRYDGYEALSVRGTPGKYGGPPMQNVRTPDSDVVFEASQEVQIRRPKPLGRSDRWGMPKTLFCLNELVFFREAILTTAEIQGFEKVDQRRCLKISFCPYRKLDGSPDRSARRTYWLDLERNGHAIQRERRRDGQRTHFTRIELEKIEDGLWFPVYGRMDADVSFVEITIDPSSVRINAPLDDRAFELDYPTGTFVDDEITGKQYYHGGRPRGSPPPSQAVMDEAIAKAELQKEAIEATSLARSGYRTWPYWLLGTVSVVVTIVGVVVVLRGRG